MGKCMLALAMCLDGEVYAGISYVLMGKCMLALVMS